MLFVNHDLKGLMVICQITILMASPSTIHVSPEPALNWNSDIRPLSPSVDLLVNYTLAELF
jgi:hypothetical protein